MGQRESGMGMVAWAVVALVVGVVVGLVWRLGARKKKNGRTGVEMGPSPAGHTWERLAEELRASHPSQFGSRLPGQKWQAWVESVLTFPHQVSHAGPRDLLEAACVRNAPVGLLEHWEKLGFDFKHRAFALDRLLWESETPSLDVMRFLLARGASADGNPVPGWASFGPADDLGDPVPYRLLPLAKLLGHDETVLTVLREHGAQETPLELEAGVDAELALWKWLLENEWSLASLERLLAAGVSPTKGLPFAIEMFHHLAVQVLLAHGADPFEKVDGTNGVVSTAFWDSEQDMRLVLEHLPASRRVEAVLLMERVEDVDLAFVEQAKQWVTTLEAGPSAMEEAFLLVNPQTDEGFSRLCSMAAGTYALANADILLRSLVSASPSRLQDILNTSTLAWVPAEFKTAVAHRKAGSLDAR